MGLYPGGLKSGMDFLLETKSSNFLSIKTSYLSNLKIDKIKSNQRSFVPLHNWMTHFEAAIIFIIVSAFLMFYQIFFSPQVKQSAIITYKHGMYELPHELPNDLRLKKLGN